MWSLLKLTLACGLWDNVPLVSSCLRPALQGASPPGSLRRFSPKQHTLSDSSLRGLGHRLHPRGLMRSLHP